VSYAVKTDTGVHRLTLKNSFW